MSIKRTVLALGAAGTLAALGLAGCQSNTADNASTSASSAATSATSKAAEKTSEKTSSETSSAESSTAEASSEEQGAVAANARPDECGLQEQQGPEGSFGPIDVSVHFFQPAEMTFSKDATMKMLPYNESQMHLEVDTKANEYGTNWGYSVDETPADLRMFYELSDSEKNVISKGRMMTMNAIDGSHYGTNLAKDTIKKPGDYSLKLTVYPPQNYNLHSDYITGVPADGWFKPLTLVMPWKVTQKNLDIVKENTVSDPMAVPDKCKKYPVKKFEDATAQKAMEKAEAIDPLPMMKPGEDK